MQMWDPRTARVIVTHDVIWLKHVHFQPDDITGVSELEGTGDIIDDMEEIHAYDATSDTSVTPPKSGGSVTWNDPVVTVFTTSRVTQSG